MTDLSSQRVQGLVVPWFRKLVKGPRTYMTCNIMGPPYHPTARRWITTIRQEVIKRV
jgi:hypothetical protein